MSIKIKRALAITMTVLALMVFALFGFGCDDEPDNTEPPPTPGTTGKPTVPPEDIGPAYTAPLSPITVGDTMVKMTFTASDNTALGYRMFIPAGYNNKHKYPLVIFLHGAGERGNDNTAQLKNAVQIMFNDITSPLYGSIFIAPQCPAAPNQWVDTPWANGNYSTASVPESNELKAVMELINNTKTTYSVDVDRIYVMGLSMGGFGTWDLIMRHTDVFAAAVPICGGADVTKATALVDKPIWTFHGDADTVVPFAGTKAMVDALEAAGSTKIQHEYLAGQGHGIWDYVAGKKEVITWLFQQKLS